MNITAFATGKPSRPTPWTAWRSRWSVKEGGNQVEYEDEDPRILELYERECAQNGVTSRMRELVHVRQPAIV